MVAPAAYDRLVRVASEHILVAAGKAPKDPDVGGALSEIRAAIGHVVWPPGSSEFTIYPESGKKRGEGNGVVPIKRAFVSTLQSMGWDLERKFPVETEPDQRNFGAIDASKVFGESLVSVEWETGNISSSHRAVNKMAVGLLEGALSAGVLVVPTVALARYLTDRIGNLAELKPYFRLWETAPIENGLLMVIAVEHDSESKDVPRIRKGTDGRSLE